MALTLVLHCLFRMQSLHFIIYACFAAHCQFHWSVASSIRCCESQSRCVSWANTNFCRCPSENCIFLPPLFKLVISPHCSWNFWLQTRPRYDQKTANILTPLEDKWQQMNSYPCYPQFIARQHMESALYAIAPPSVRLSVHVWISQQRLK